MGGVLLADGEWVDREALSLGNNKEVFDAGLFAIYQAVRVSEARGLVSEEIHDLL